MDQIRQTKPLLDVTVTVQGRPNELDDYRLE